MTGTARVTAVAALSLSAACGVAPVSPEPPPPEPIEPPAPVAAEPEVSPREVRLAQDLARSDLKLLQLEAQIGDLQARLDEARQEVVRAMARQESQASRAEAASAIAEAEIALQSLVAAGRSAGSDEVARLVGLASAAFDRGNYAGALYMAGQAKGAAFEARGQSGSAGGAAMRPGERAFAAPLPLRTTRRANVREGPGTTHKVLFTLDPDTAVSGLAQAGEWLRIEIGSGRTGWIYQGLIARRQ